jgi:opacity protein-like surface antigen
MLRRSLFIVCILVAGIALSLGCGYAQEKPDKSDGQYKTSYAVLKGGIFYPRGDLDDLSTGFNGEVAYGYKFHPNAAVELGGGYLQTNGTFRQVTNGVGVKVEDEVYAIPITAAIKGIVKPEKNTELYALIGGGAYIVSCKETVSAGGRSVSMSDTAVVPGGFVGVGASYDITENVFLGLEGKYTFTGEATLRDTLAGVGDVSANFKVQGFTGTMNLGIRF